MRRGAERGRSVRRAAQMYDSTPTIRLDKGCGDKEAHHVSLLPTHFRNAPNRTRHRHLHSLEDAHPQERQNHPNLRRPCKLQETRIRKQDFAEVDR